jgi:predicted murein hydrolase (TIGR00659 family)
VVLTLTAFLLGQRLQQKLKSPLMNPILIAVILVLVFLGITGISVKTYQSGMSGLSWLLTPATVCLAVPMYEQFQLLKKNLPAIAAGVAAGALSCLCMVLVFGILAGFDPVLTVSLLPKSITTAIGLALTENNGGMSALTTFAIVVTGILGNLSGSAFCKLLKITDPIAQGVGFGTASHVIGTSRAMEVDPLTGAVSSLSLAVAGIITAVVFPMILMLL